MRVIPLLLFSLAALVGCAETGGPLRGSRFHSFGYGNHGVGPVTNVEIHYADLILPTSHSVREKMSPQKIGGVLTAESQDAIVPDSARIAWTSSDGENHIASIPVRQLIPDLDLFQGFDFFFVDDHVDVYLRALGPKGVKYKETRVTKVFSTTDE